VWFGVGGGLKSVCWLGGVGGATLGCYLCEFLNAPMALLNSSYSNDLGRYLT